jgi:hypothetical protein
VSPALLYGISFHEGKATWYRTKSEAKAKQKIRTELKKVRTLFEHAEEFETAMFRGPVLLQHWINKFGYSDFEKYDIIAVEGDFEQELPSLPGFKFTGRIDLVVREKSSGKYFVIDTKTSSSSKEITENGVWYGDQATSYIWLASKKLDVKIEGMIADIAYWHKIAKGENNIDCFRGGLVERTGQDIHAFLSGLQQTFSEISQKVAAYKNGMDENVLFPRNTFYCMSYSKPCEFVSICRLKLSPNKMPMGFTKDKRELNLGGGIDDQIVDS